MNYYNEIKNKLIDNEIYKQVKEYSKNKNDLTTYYEVGRLLIEAQGGEKRAKYGDNLIKDFCNKLQEEVDKKYNERTLRRIRQFYIIFKKENWSTLSTELTWSHYSELVMLNDNNKIQYYINITRKQKLSVRQLRKKIKSKEYERLPEDTKNKLISNNSLEVQDLVKNPIIIKNTLNKDVISEKVLKQLILEDISSFLKELGEGFCYIDQEYKIKIGNTYNYIDLLLFNIEYNCYVVIELKITELKKEHIGQIQIYMNYIDKNLRGMDDHKSIGIIICKKIIDTLWNIVLTKEYFLENMN
jgi:predicted nuclease of restriction endonuclease-like (RecB) superfamily